MLAAGATISGPTSVASPAKYRSKETVVDGTTFDSKHEAERWSINLIREKAGQISGLKRQVKIPLTVNRTHCGYLIVDFAYIENGVTVYEDAKGFKTPLYRLKKRLVKAIHRIEILET